VTATLWETLFAGSEPVTVIVLLPAVVVVVVETVKTAEPEPPVIVLLSKAAAMFEFDEEALSDTVPVKPLTAETLMV
jgi:hypothetical protein